MVAIIASAFLVGVAPHPAIADPDPLMQACQPQIAKGDADKARADAHNARPNTFELPREQAAFDAYNAEAQELRSTLNADAQALDQCGRAAAKLLDAGRSSYTPDPTSRAAQAQIAKLAAAPKPSPSWRPPDSSPPRGMTSYSMAGSPVKPYYDILRRDNPGRVGSPTFQGKPKPAAGEPDPAYPGQTIPLVAGQPAVSPDHIVPLAELVNLPGFTDLSPLNMWLIANAPLNLQWISRKANQAKSSGFISRATGIDPAWAQEQDQLQLDTREALTALIAQLNGTQ